MTFDDNIFYFAAHAASLTDSMRDFIFELHVTYHITNLIIGFSFPKGKKINERNVTNIKSTVKIAKPFVFTSNVYQEFLL